MANSFRVGGRLSGWWTAVGLVDGFRVGGRLSGWRTAFGLANGFRVGERLSGWWTAFGLVDGAALVHIWSAPRCKSEIAVEQKKEKLRPYIRHLDEVA
ncbi:hypothetical protein, partial [Thiohalocapsa marina]|uniref:hypothetical protein n=1 Tax=Thiohalocapsa marina TaxID=424902 RepID=UPI0036DAD3F6